MTLMRAYARYHTTDLRIIVAQYFILLFLSYSSCDQGPMEKHFHISEPKYGENRFFYILCGREDMAFLKMSMSHIKETLNF